MGDGWRFLSTHGLVLVAIATNDRATQRELAETVGVTEKTVQKVISDLVAAGYLERAREGRRNRYTVNSKAPLRHPLVRSESQVGALLKILRP